MNTRTKLLCSFAVFLFLGSMAFTGVNAYVSLTASADQINPAETYGDDRRNEAVNILIYTEVADTTVGGEWENVMNSMIGSLEGKFTYENLTDYTHLGAMIGEFDVFLIMESELANYTFAYTVNAAWAGILPSFVEEGGIVICMNAGPSPGMIGVSAQMINSTLITVFNPSITNGHQIDLVNPNDALARNVAASYPAPLGDTICFDILDAVEVLEDNTNGKTVVAHKTMGMGHVALLAFDMFVVDTNQDFLLRNAILLHRHIVVDNSHGQTMNILIGFSDFAEQMPYEGFSVSSMDIFDPAMIAASKILLVPFCYIDFNSTEIATIDDFVRNGGGLFVMSEFTNHGDALDPLINHFGYVRNETALLADSDDYTVSAHWPYFYPENIQMHSTKIGVDIVETYAPAGLIEIPVGATQLLTMDTDGTATWDGVEDASGVPIAACNLLEGGRIMVFCDNGPFIDNDVDGDGPSGYYDQDNEIWVNNALRWLAGAGIPEQTVVFDQSHGPFGYVHGSYSPLVNLLMFNGYNVEFMSVFNPTSFNDADILFISDGSTDYNATELAEIRTYVQNGGGLFLLGDHGSLSQQIDPIAQEFGLVINTTGYLDDSDDDDSAASYVVYEGSNILPHPITDGVERIEIDRGNGFISVGSGTALVVTDNDDSCTWSDGSPANNVPVFAATLYSMGRVVYLTDINLPAMGDGDSDGFGLLYDSDNSVLMGNAFKWLAENRAPSVTVVTPNGGEVLNGTITIEWDAYDFDSDPMTFDVFYSDNNGTDWSSLANDIVVPVFEWNTTLHDDGTDYMIRVEVTAGGVTAEDISDDPFELDNFGNGGLFGIPIDTTTLIIIIAGVIVVIIIIVIVMKKKK